MNLNAAKAQREKILARMGDDNEEPRANATPELCLCGKPRKHMGRCQGVKQGPRATPKAQAQPLAQPTETTALAAPVPAPVTTAIAIQPHCTWRIDFCEKRDDGDDTINMAGRGREKFETVIKLLYTLIS